MLRFEDGLIQKAELGESKSICAPTRYWTDEEATARTPLELIQYVRGPGELYSPAAYRAVIAPFRRSLISHNMAVLPVHSTSLCSADRTEHRAIRRQSMTSVPHGSRPPARSEQLHRRYHSSDHTTTLWASHYDNFVVKERAPRQHLPIALQSSGSHSGGRPIITCHSTARC